jgi:hypothetical protein
VGGVAQPSTPGPGSVGPTQLADNAVTTPKIAADAVTTAKILDANVTSAKLYTPMPAPVGTRVAFQQTAAPTGWTKDVSAGLNDSCMRIVTGAVGSGGATAYSGVFGVGKNSGAASPGTSDSTTPADTGATAPGSTDGYTLVTADTPSHTHPQQANTELNAGGGAANALGSALGTIGGTTQATGGGGAHAHAHTATHTHTSAAHTHAFTGTHLHTLSLDLKFNDVIIASKD